MAFYDLPKPEREQLVERINLEISSDFIEGTSENIITYFSDEDTYIRKTAYLAVGKKSNENCHHYKEMV